MAPTNNGFTGVFVTDESGNHYLIPGKWVDQLRISPDDRREMEKSLNAEVSGYNAKDADFVAMYFGSAFIPESGKWTIDSDPPGDAKIADRWTNDGVVNILDWQKAKSAK